MSTLSPAAQAVDRAIAASIQLHGEMIHAQHMAAAALRAAADQVVPYVHSPGGCREGERQCVRRELLAIAAELEGQP
jgi:hypothetical protein